MRTPALLALLVSLTACEPTQVCTLAGCEDAVLVDFPGWPLDDGTYEVAVMGANGQAYMCGVVVTESGRSLDSQGCDDPAAIFSVAVDRDGVGTMGVRTPLLGDEITVEVSFDGEVVIADAAPLDYQTVQPNGPSCEPTCTIGIASFALP